jgi:DNA-binding transcriptional LysR family regulator
MDLRQLEYVVGVVDHAGFTRAARALHVSQAALSEGIARLEAELGVQLFDRLGRSVRLTAAGTALLEPARRVLRDAAVLQTSVAAVKGLVAGSLELVALPTLAVDPLAPLVGAFRRAHPGVTVRIHQPEEAATVARLVRAGTAEVGLTELPISGPSLEQRAIVTQELVAVLPAESPLATRRRVSLVELADVPLVLLPEGTSTRTIVDGAFADVDREPTIVVVLDQREALVPMVLAGAGAAIVPGPMAAQATSMGAAMVAISPRLRRTVGFVWRSGPLSPAARAFVALAGAEDEPAPTG